MDGDSSIPPSEAGVPAVSSSVFPLQAPVSVFRRASTDGAVRPAGVQPSESDYPTGPVEEETIQQPSCVQPPVQLPVSALPGFESSSPVIPCVGPLVLPTVVSSSSIDSSVSLVLPVSSVLSSVSAIDELRNRCDAIEASIGMSSGIRFGSVMCEIISIRTELSNMRAELEALKLLVDRLAATVASVSQV